MGEIIRPNIVECPNCLYTFTNNRINGLALIELISDITTRSRVQCKITLDTLEKENEGKLSPNVRKAVLDGYNDLARGICTLLGFGTEVE